MGRVKDFFVDLKSMTKEELEVYKAELAAKGKDLPIRKPVSPPINSTFQTKLVYKKSFSKREREMWREELSSNHITAFHAKHVNEIRNQLSLDLSVKDYSLALKLLKKVSLLRFLGVKVGRGQNFPCPIIAGNLASVNYDEDGNWEYFSRNKEKTEGYVFGIVDIMQLLYDLNFYAALDKLCEMLLIEVEQAQWRQNQQAKYTQNLLLVSEADSHLAILYPDLYKYIKRHLYLLAEMNRLGIVNLMTEQDAFHCESVFFASTRFIQDRLKDHGIDKNRGIITKLLNMFASLGLIQKVFDDQIPEHLKERARKEMGNKEYHYTVSFFCIPDMSHKVLMEANRRTILLNEAGIKATGITVDTMGDVLGLEVLNAVYGNEGRRNIIRAIKHIKQENWEWRQGFDDPL